eukprot:6179672-Pleurochrysis_carterae.AAC.1
MQKSLTTHARMGRAMAREARFHARFRAFKRSHVRMYLIATLALSRVCTLSICTVSSMRFVYIYQGDGLRAYVRYRALPRCMQTVTHWYV